MEMNPVGKNPKARMTQAVSDAFLQHILPAGRDFMATSIVFYGIPLTASISLVYCASRYEMPERILRTALVMFVKTLLGLLGLYLFLMYLSR